MKNFKKKLPAIKYYLEIISIPIFAYLVFHLAGHSFAEILESGHGHTGDSHGHGEGNFLEIFFGIFALIFFTWIWNTKKMKRFVPCSHTHCHGEKIIFHILASLAFVFHFFPEALIRQEILNNFEILSIFSVAGFVAFFSHFVIDIIIIFLLSSYWRENFKKAISFFLMIFFYILSFFAAKSGGIDLGFLGNGEFFVGIFSAFLLAMFIHIPEKPEKKACKKC